MTMLLVETINLELGTSICLFGSKFLNFGSHPGLKINQSQLCKRIFLKRWNSAVVTWYFLLKNVVGVYICCTSFCTSPDTSLFLWVPSCVLTSDTLSHCSRIFSVCCAEWLTLDRDRTYFAMKLSAFLFKHPIMMLDFSINFNICINFTCIVHASVPSELMGKSWWESDVYLG